MTAAELIGSLQRRGVLLVPTPEGNLRYHPRDAVSEAERAVLTRHRKAILAMLAIDPTGWRVAVMATQSQSRTAIPRLVARPDARITPGSCCSCGDPLAKGDRYRCGACIAATIAVLEQATSGWPLLKRTRLTIRRPPTGPSNE